MSNNPKPIQVAVMMGSASDSEIMQHCTKQLQQLGISFQARILSAHRTPQQTVQFIQQAEQAGVRVFIAAAGMAAHLAGTVAAHTIRPVIGIPLPGGMQDGLDALLSTVQMPGGMPVACVSVGKAGAKNAALLAAQIIAQDNPPLQQQLTAMREQKRQELAKQDQAWQQEHKHCEQPV